jgi:hypothetical protein
VADGETTDKEAVVSCSLYWRPVGNGHQVGDNVLRDAVTRRFGRGARLDYGAMDFLRGLEAGGVEGADKLIEAIERHDEIEIYLEC